MSEEKSMKDYENELERSFQVLREGDILDVTVIGVSDTEVTVDLNYYTEGIIPIEECSDDPSFSIKKDMIIGDVIQAMVLDPENASGNVILSRKEANRVLVWDELKEDMADGTVFDVKITEAVPAGVVGYVRGIRAFIPASQLALTYVEDTESYVGMTVQAVIITVEKDIQKLVLKLASEGMSVTFISSETDEMLRTCSRLVVMRDRKVVGELSGEDLTQTKIMSTIAGGESKHE